MAHDADEQKPVSTGGMADSVLVQVCLGCGQQYFFEEAQPPADLKCERCGNRVFRSFFDVTSNDEVVADFEESTARDLATDAPATDVSRSDLHDLNNP